MWFNFGWHNWCKCNLKVEEAGEAEEEKSGSMAQCPLLWLAPISLVPLWWTEHKHIHWYIVASHFDANFKETVEHKPGIYSIFSSTTSFL